jgi:Spy/CpxP family protein refolding chaperone
MKMQIAAVAFVLTLAVAGFASARSGGMGGGMGPGMNCPQGQMTQQLDKATQDKLDAFHRDTLAQRKDMFMKKAEMKALMGSETPDRAAVSKLSGEIFDLKIAIKDKAKAAGVEAYVGGHGKGMGKGMGMGMGKGMKCDCPMMDAK